METISQRDYYEVLGIAHQCRPEGDQGRVSGERFKEIAAAYAVLSDPAKRAAYDAGGTSRISVEDLFGGINFEDVFAGLGFDFGGGLFDRLSGRRPAGPRRGQNIEVTHEIPLERIAQGGPETVHFRRSTPCQACSGSGAGAGTNFSDCDRCGGTGRLVISHREQQVAVRRSLPAPSATAAAGSSTTPAPSAQAAASRRPKSRCASGSRPGSTRALCCVSPDGVCPAPNRMARTVTCS